MNSTTYQIDSGLIADNSTNPPTCCGYIWDAKEHGMFAPAGHVRFTKEQVAEHNRLLGLAEIEGMKRHNRGLLYLTESKDGIYGSTVSNRVGSFRVAIHAMKKSFPNFAGRNGRTDIWFTWDNSVWHGVKIGYSKICRVSRNK